MNLDRLSNPDPSLDVLYIYKIECLKNGKVYVGRTRVPLYRAQLHLGALKGNRHNVEDLQSDFNRFGEDAFTFEVLERCTRSRKRHIDCVDGNKEKHYMLHYKSYLREYGYNYKEPMRKELRLQNSAQ